MAHPVDGLVNRRFLFDIGIRPSDIGLGLVIVIVTDKIFDCVFGEEAFHFAVKLRRQYLVRGKDERGALQLFNDLCHREGLARTGHAKQHLIAFTCKRGIDKFADRRRLVTGGFIFGDNLERPSTFRLCRAFRLMRNKIAVGLGLVQPAPDNKFSHVRYMCSLGSNVTLEQHCFFRPTETKLL